MGQSAIASNAVLEIMMVESLCEWVMAKNKLDND
jgi:hypothetical protein